MSLHIIIIIITGIFSYMGFSDHRFFEKYKFSVSGIKAGEYYRLITSGFLHADWNHFFVNMITLYFFGDYIIYNLGNTGFLIVYFGGIFLGNYLSYYLHKNDLWYSAIGASAGVNAIVFSAITLDPMMKLYLYFFIPLPGIIFALGYLWYTVKGSQNTMSRIGHEAHFGGAIAGVVLTILLDFKLGFLAHPLLTILIAGALVGGYYYINGNKKLM